MAITSRRLLISFNRVLSMAAAATMLAAAWSSFAGSSSGVIAKVFATIAVAGALLGTFAVTPGTRLAYVLLWAAVGMTLGLGITSLLSIGAVYLGAALLLGVAIAATPNRTGRPRWDLPYVAVQLAAFLLVVSSVIA